MAAKSGIWVRIAADGHITWRGELPPQSATDCFVAFELEPNGDVLANTWSGYQVRLAAQDGRLLSSVFIK